MNRLTLIIVCMLTSCICYANEENSLKKEINGIASPSAPAFTILDLNPSSIARPHTPRDLSISILTAAGESDSRIPDNLSMEFTPYWWKSRPTISFSDYVNEKNILDRIKRSASVSIASSSRTEDEVTSTDLAFGLRFNIFSGNPSKSTDDVVKAQTDLVTIIGDNEDCINDVNSDACKKAISASEKALDTTIEEFRKSSDRRTGFQSDIALAFAYSFPENDTSERELLSSAIWLNTSFTPKGNSKGGFQYLGVVRYSDKKNSDGVSNDSFDLGVRAIWKHETRPLALSIEYLNRFNSEDDDAKRYSGIIEYRINETLNFVASFGKNFEENESNDDLFVLGGVNFNFGTGPSIDFD